VREEPGAGSGLLGVPRPRARASWLAGRRTALCPDFIASGCYASADQSSCGPVGHDEQALRPSHLPGRQGPDGSRGDLDRQPTRYSAAAERLGRSWAVPTAVAERLGRLWGFSRAVQERLGRFVKRQRAVPERLPRVRQIALILRSVRDDSCGLSESSRASGTIPADRKNASGASGTRIARCRTPTRASGTPV
jgi:hypothetical protein